MKTEIFSMELIPLHISVFHIVENNRRVGTIVATYEGRTVLIQYKDSPVIIEEVPRGLKISFEVMRIFREQFGIELELT